MPDILKKGDKAKRMCGSNCMRARKCEMFSHVSRHTAVPVVVDRLNPMVQGCYDVHDKNGFKTTCPRDHLEKVKASTPYWGMSQHDEPEPKPKPVKKPTPVEPGVLVPTAGIDDFGYGPACSFPTCHAMQNENHSSSCPKEGPFDPRPR
jgi:hypothetical protein